MIYRNKACPLLVNQRQRRDNLGELYVVSINQGDHVLFKMKKKKKKKKLLSGTFVSFQKVFFSSLSAFPKVC